MSNDIVDQLCDLRAPAILIKAANNGLISAVVCGMEECLCPRGRQHFTAGGNPKRNPWMISVDRVLPGCQGGEYMVDNVRTAHLKCNMAAGSRLGGRNNHTAAGAIAVNAKYAGTQAQSEWLSRAGRGNKGKPKSDMHRQRLSVASKAAWAPGGKLRLAQQARMMERQTCNIEDVVL